jgi:predicted RND superfamily exporter protein
MARQDISKALSAAAARAAYWIDARRRPILVITFLAALAAAGLASQLAVEGDFSHLLPPSELSVMHLRALETRTRVPSTFMVGVESDDPALRARTAQALFRRFQQIDPEFVARVTYDQEAARRFVWDNRFLFVPLSELRPARDALRQKIADASPLNLKLEDEPESQPESDPTSSLRARLDEAQAAIQSKGGMVSSDHRLQLILVRAGFSAEDGTRGRELLKRLVAAEDATRAEVGPGVTIGMTGDVITTLAEHRALLNGMLVSTLFTVTLVMLALLLFYRSSLAVGALLWSLAVGALLTFGFTKLTVGHLNLASAFLSSIVIGNGINFGIVLLARYLEERRGGREGVEAIAAAMAGTAPGTLAAALAAAMAYGSLAVTQFRGFRDFGIIGGVGMLLCWITAYTVFPAALAELDRRRKITVHRELRVGAFLARIVPHRPRAVAIGSLVCLFVLGAATTRFLTTDPLESDLGNLRSRSPDIAEASAWMRKFDKAFGHGISGGFVLAVPQRAEATPVAAKLRGVDEGKSADKQLLSHISTLDDLLPHEQLAKLKVLADIRRLVDRVSSRLGPEERRKLAEVRPPDTLRPLVDGDVPEELAWPYIERDGKRGRLILANTGPAVDMWNTHDLQRFVSTVRSLGFGPEVIVGGSAFVNTDMLAAMERDGPRATLVAGLGSVLVVLLLVGRGRHGVVTLVCATLGTLAMLTGGWLLGIKVNFLDFVALPITIGIGVDYAVNIAARARQTSGPHAGRRALVSTGGAIVLCSYTTIVGYASLLFSQNRGIHTFGLSAMLGEVTCLAAALVVAPALLDVGRLRVEKMPVRPLPEMEGMPTGLADD